MASVLGAALIAAQAPGAEGGAKASDETSAPRVDAAHAKRVHARIRRRLATGEAAGDPIPVSGLTGVKVTLRWLGLTVGTGMRALGAADGVRDLGAAADAAAKDAIAGLRARLHDAKRRAALARRKSGATTLPAPDGSEPVGAFVEQVAPSLQVELQLARRFERIRVPPAAAKSAVYHTFAPGHHGLRLRAPESAQADRAAWVWPASALAHNQSPRGQMLALLRGAGAEDPFAAFGRIARPNGYRLERFRVIHAVRPARHAPVTILTRGHRVVPASAIDGPTLASMSRRMAGFLRRLQREDGSFRGPYRPSADRYQPASAEPASAALAVYALHRLARRRAAAGREAGAKPLRRAVRRGIDALIQRGPEDGVTGSTRANALLAMTIAESPRLGDRKPARDAARRRIVSRLARDGRLVDEEGEPLPAETQAMGAAALAAVYRATRGEAVGEAVAAALEAAWQSRAARRPMSVPWLLRAAEAVRPLGLIPRATIERRNGRLAELVRRVGDRQIRSAPARGPPDVLGGFRLGSPPAFLDAAPPNPDWRSAVLFGVLSLAAGRTNGAEVNELVRGALAARFVAQLMFDTPSAYYARSPRLIRGGVRRSLWDNRLDPAATAHALLATTAFRRRLAADPRVDAPSPATAPAGR